MQKGGEKVDRESSNGPGVPRDEWLGRLSSSGNFETIQLVAEWRTMRAKVFALVSTLALGACSSYDTYRWDKGGHPFQ